MNYGIASRRWSSLLALVRDAGITVSCDGAAGSPCQGAAVRVAALALICLRCQSVITREDREPLTSVAAVVVDRSQSQNLGTRTPERRNAQAALVDRPKKIPGPGSARSWDAVGRWRERRHAIVRRRVYVHSRMYR